MNSLTEVISNLETIVTDARQQNRAYGYFAVLYLQMTKRVKQGIENGAFEDAERMVQLDMKFAKRYFDAITGWKANQPTSACWKLAFEASSTDEISVIQHLLCGINAHINLDLGIAAAETAPSDNIHALKTDFYRINDIIGNLMTEVQLKLGTISWPMRFLDELAGDSDSKIANFSIFMAREAAWKVAMDLAKTPSVAYMEKVDIRTEKLSKRIINPGFLPNFILKPVKWFENASIPDKMKVLMD